MTPATHDVTPASARSATGVWQALWASRLVIWLAGTVGVLEIGNAEGSTAAYDPTHLTAPFGNYLANAVVSPLARWDSVWYLTIARSGYANSPERMVYFPLYPILIRSVGIVTRSDLVAGVLISLIAFAIALAVLHRLVSLDFDQEVATATVTLIAFSPMAFFFSAVYTESLFLALSVGAFYSARRERWLLAGVLGGLAAMSRNGGIVLILPLAWIYLYGERGVPPGPRTLGRSGPAPLERLAVRALLARALPRNRARVDLLYLLLMPAGLGFYLLYLGLRYGRALAPFRAESDWYRHTTFPLTTAWRGAEQAWNGLTQLIDGPTLPYHVPAYAASVVGAATEDICLFGFLLLGLVALVYGFRRLPVAYSIYALAMLVVALADPVSLQPLASLPRYELVIFPLFICAAQLLVRRRLLTAGVAVSAVMLGLFTVQFTTWHWIA